MISNKLYDGTMPNYELMTEAALAWIADDYPKKWLRLVNLCEAAANRGEKCVRRGDVYRLSQEARMSITQCNEFRFDNNLWSPISRYLLMFRPSLAKVIHPRDNSPIDKAGINFAEKWRELVNPETFFLFETWQEARNAKADF